MAVSLFGVLAAPMLAPALVSAQTNNTLPGVCSGANLEVTGIDSTASENCTGNGFGEQGTSTVTNMIRLVINILSLIVGVVAVVMIIIGGIKYITSGGDSGNISGAKNTILYAVIGLIVVAAAQFIVRFVLGRVGTAVQ